MSLQDELLEAIRPNGMDLVRLYRRFADHGRERIDYALQGLAAAGEIYRSNRTALPRPTPLQYRCSQCHELRARDRMLETGVCLHCVSDSLITIDQRPTKVCPRCEREFARDGIGKRTYCPPCTSSKNAEYHARGRDRARAQYQKQAAVARAAGKTRQGVPKWETLSQAKKKTTGCARRAASASRSC
jgi:hypothetical protein